MAQSDRDSTESVSGAGSITISSERFALWQQHVEHILAGTTTIDFTVLDRLPILEATAGIKQLTLRPTVTKAIQEKRPDLSVGAWKNLPNLLADPLFVLPHRLGNPNAVLIARSDKGSPIIVGIRDDEIRTITPLDESGGKIPGERLSERLREALRHPVTNLCSIESGRFA